MNWLKILSILAPSIIAIGGIFLTKPEKSTLAKFLVLLIIITTIIVIVLENKDNKEKNNNQIKAEEAYKKIDEQHSIILTKDKRIADLEEEQEKQKEKLEDVDSKAESLKILPKITIENGNFKNLGFDGSNHKFIINIAYVIESEIPARAYNIRQVDCEIYDGLNKAGNFKIEDSYIFQYQRGERTKTLDGGSRIQIIDPKVKLIVYVGDEIIESDIFDLGQE